MKKYEPLRSRIEELTNKKCSLITVVVSSLGILYKESMNLLNQMLKLTNKKKNTVERRISTAALIGSFFVFYKLKGNTSEFNIDDETAGLPEIENY